MSEALGNAVLELRTDVGAFNRQLATAKSTAMTSFGSMQSGANALSGVLRRAFSFGFAVLAVRRLGRAIGDAVKTFASFEQSLANVQSVARATPEAFVQLKNAAMEAGRTTRFTASQAADALYYLASAGMDANQSMNALSGVLNLAGATQSDLAFTSEAVASALSQFNLEASDAERVANVFTASIQNSQATMEKLATSMAYVGPVASGLGMSIEQTAGALQILYNAGLQATTAGTAMRSILADLSNASSPAISALQQLGISFEQVNPLSNDFASILDVLRGAGVDAGQAMAIFGQRAGPAMIKLLEEGGDAVRQYTDAVTGTNAAAEAYATQNDTLAGSFDRMKSAAEGVKLAFVDSFGPAMRLVVERITEGLTGIATWFTENRDRIVNFFLHFPEIAGLAFRTIMRMLGTMLTADFIFNGIKSIWEFLIASAKTTFEFLWSLIKAIGTTIWTPLKHGFEVISYAIQQAWRAVVDFIIDVINNSIIVGINGIVEGLETVINKAVEAVGWVRHMRDEQARAAWVAEHSISWSGVAPVVAPTRSPLSAPGQFNPDAIKDAWEAAGTQFLDTLSTQWTNVKELLGDVLDPLSGDFDAFLSEFAKIVNQELPESLRSSIPGGGTAGSGGGGGLSTARAPLVAPAFVEEIDAFANGLNSANLQFTNIAKTVPNMVETMLGFSTAVDDATQAAIEVAPAWRDIDQAAGTWDTGTPDLSGMGRGWSFGVTEDAVNQLVGALTNSVSGLSQLTSAAGVLAIFMSGFAGALQDILAGPLSTIIGIIVTQGAFLGQVLAPLFQILAGAVEVAGRAFVWLYNNIWVPVGNALQIVFKVIFTVFWAFGQALTNVVNAIIDMINVLKRESKKIAHITNPFGDSPPEIKGTLTKITLDAVKQAGSDYGDWNTDTSSSGASASYQQQRPIEVTQNIYDNYVLGGDIREFALILKEEFEDIDELGL